MAVATNQPFIIIDVKIHHLSNCEVYDAMKMHVTVYYSAFEWEKWISCLALYQVYVI